jgi:hypothetical protein
MNKQHPTESQTLPDQHDHEAAEACDALATTDHPDSVIDALASQAAWDARCEAAAWSLALALAGGDAWVCERLALVGGGV